MNMASLLRRKADRARAETLRLHCLFPETRIASSLSAVEIFTVLYYGNVMRFNPKDLTDKTRDRLIISKGHGAISVYSILADLGFFALEKLERIGQAGSFLGGIPDPTVPGFETVNGSLGHGLGVACGIAIALKRAGSSSNVIVVMGDGELYEGAVWEAVMFAAHHALDNLFLIIDNNKICMLDYCKNVLNLEPIDRRFNGFGWRSFNVDGHDVAALHGLFHGIFKERLNIPTVIVADTVKGKGVPALEKDALCHIRSLKTEDVKALLKGRS